MSKTNKTIILMAASALSGLAGAAAAQDTAPPTDMAALFACQTKIDDAARLLCFDAAVSTLAATKVETRVTLSRDQVKTLEQDAFGFNLPSLKQMRGLFGSGKSDDADARPDKEDTKPLNRVTLEVERWETFNRGRYRFYLTNGQVWSQTESDSLSRPRAGKNGVIEIEIRKASFGSFLLKVNGKGRSVRVRRSE